MYIYENYYIRDFIRETKHYFSNKNFDKINHACSRIDSIKSYDVFKTFVIENIKGLANNSMLIRDEFGGEGLFYGNRNALFEYADINSSKQRFIFPFIEHGADLREQINVDIYDRINHSFVFQSDYKNEIVRGIRPYAPIYNVGPYIHYAKSYYNEDEILDIKRKLGKTVLLFPAHTFEGASVSYDREKFVDNVMNKFMSLYDSIIVCVYWNDVDDPIYEEFRKNGAHLVSAGFRGDFQFLSRLRSLIEIADVVASNLTGSYVGFARALNKPVYLFQEKAEFYSAKHQLLKKDEDKYQNLIDAIFYAHSSLTPDDKQLEMQKQIYEKYWGGAKFIKSKEDIRNIIYISESLLKKSNGTTRNIEKEINKIMKSEGVTYLNDKQYVLLKQSIGLVR